MDTREEKKRVQHSIQKPTLEMKKRAVKYYNENMVPKHLEELLNTMFLEDPPDIYGYMSDYFGALSKEPVVSNIVLSTSIGSNTTMTGKGKLFCTVKGIDKFVVDVPFMVDAGPYKEAVKVKVKSAASTRGKKEKAPPEPLMKVELPKRKKFEFEAYLEVLDNMASKLQGLSIFKQEEFDENLTKLKTEYLTEDNQTLAEFPSEEIPIIERTDETGKTEENVAQIPDVCEGCLEDPALKTAHVTASSLFLSFLAAHGTSQLKHQSLTEHLMAIFDQTEDELYLPIPAVPILSAGTSSPGKLNMAKYVYIVPKADTTYAEGLLKICEVIQELGSVVIHKFGSQGHFIDDDFVRCPPFEKIEQVFEIIQAALTAKNLAMEDFHFILDAAASDYYDEEKKRYEISAGHSKPSEDLINIYSELVDKYPIVAIIDGLSQKDLDHWKNLNLTLGSRCHIIGDIAFNDNIEECLQLISNKGCNGCRFSLSSFGCQSITHMKTLLSSIKESGAVIMIDNKSGKLSNLVALDGIHVALASQGAFIDIGSPLHGANIHNYNILIEKEQTGNYKQRKDLEFQVFPEEKEENEQDEENN